MIVQKRRPGLRSVTVIILLHGVAFLPCVEDPQWLMTQTSIAPHVVVGREG